MSKLSALAQALFRGRTAVRVGFAVTLLTFLPGSAAFADDARGLRLEAAALVQAAENVEPGSKERQELLEQAHGKLVEIQERFPSASAEFQLFLGGKRVHWSPEDVRRAARAAARLASLSGPEVGRLRDVLGREISPSTVDENGWTDLHWAAALNLPELAKALLDIGADVAAAVHHDAEPLSERLKQSMNELGLKLKFSRKGYHPSHIAALADAKEVLAVLFAAGAEVDAKANQNDWTLLHAAAYADSKEVAAVLVERDADVNAKSKTGLTPLHTAARNNSRDVAAILIERGDDVNAKSSSGSTPLHFAARGNTGAVATILIERGADVNAKNNSGGTPLHIAAREKAGAVAAILIERGGDVNAKNNSGETPLHFTARGNAGAVVAILIERGASIFAKDALGLTPKDIAQHLDNREVLTALAERHANYADRLKLVDTGGLRDVLGREISPSAADENGWTDLHFAAALNLPELAEVLLDAGADITAALIAGDGLYVQRSHAARVLEKLGIDHYKITYYSGQHPLHVAAIFGSHEMVSLLVTYGASVNERVSNGLGFTPLDYAVWNNRQSIVEFLLDRGANDNVNRAFSMAVQQDAVEVAALLIGYGADIRPIRTGELLHLAALMNSSRSAGLLLRLGADVNARDENGSAPLHTAVAGKHATSTEVAALLIERGADIHARDDKGETPMDIAERTGSKETLAILAKRQSVHIDRLKTVDANNLRNVLGREISPFAVDENGWTDLHFAAVLNLPELAEALLDAGAGVAATLKGDGQALSAGLKQSLKRLGVSSEFRRRTYSPLHMAVFHDARKVAALLVERGADIHAKDHDGNTPLHLAASGNAREAATLLIERGADIHAKNQIGGTPLHLAASRNARDAAALLIERGADIHAKNHKYGNTPLHRAASGNAREAATLLIERGADIHAKNQGGNTPLHLTASRNAREAAALLIERGADISLENRGGQTPVERAEVKMARYLKARAARRAEVLLPRLDVGNLRDVLGRELSLTVVDDNGWTDLHYAAALNLPELAQTLLGAGSNIDAKLKDDGQELSKRLQESLTTLGVGSGFSRKGYTPLYMAALNNAREVGLELIGRGADTDPKRPRLGSMGWWTPLHFAAIGNAPEIAIALIEAGTDVDFRTGLRGMTPLQIAAVHNADLVATELLSRGADVDAGGGPLGDMTPLFLAVRHDSPKVAEALVAYGADVTWKGMNGRTLLHVAAENGISPEIAASLMDGGIKVDAKDIYRNTAMDIAKGQGHTKLLEVLTRQ